MISSGSRVISADFSLGFLYHAQPALMTAEPSARIMDDIFTAKEEEGLVRLLRIIQEFLVSEAGKHSVKEKGLCTIHPQWPRSF